MTFRNSQNKTFKAENSREKGDMGVFSCLRSLRGNLIMPFIRIANVFAVWVTSILRSEDYFD